MRDDRAAVSMITNLESEVLVVWNPVHNGWVMPGGKVEKGETVDQAQRRELKEETGLETVFATEVYCEEHGPVGERGKGVNRMIHVFHVFATGKPKAETDKIPQPLWMRIKELTNTTNKQSPYREFYREMFEFLSEPPIEFIGEPPR